ncbi:rhodanese-like domain-containing protein [Flavobacterium sp. MFBS3-15]|uniref:sulfurtransferase n=1 Tax=Flavobacterium sp. MFBS3-15 TaxID=2989816 RepID=UPI002235547A|nr:rhodanese-like domain-containing protein [Flavobacterium sp. MFBS3-15]MCW4470401.1 rhodanese-like domain-containing protein [Flavobacterium sp. MFBS3-15]
MQQPLPPIIGPKELLLLPKGGYILIDAGPSRERYNDTHLQGALYADLNADLAQVPPDPKDGGMQAAQKEGFAASHAIETPKGREDYTFLNWQLPTADMDGAATAAAGGESIVIDVRDKERFAGITEPVDPIAGHIPGAINIPFASNLDADGKFLSPELLREKYVAALGNIPTGNVIVHCGSGVTACHTLLALELAGLGIPALYVGSWSEWSRNGKPIAGNIK